MDVFPVDQATTKMDQLESVNDVQLDLRPQEGRRYAATESFIRALRVAA